MEHGEIKRMGTHVESRNQLRESKTVLAEHFQRLEPVVICPIFEFQSNLIVACSTLGQLQSNSRGIVSCVGLYEQKAEESGVVLTNSRYPGVGHCGISDVEQADERLVVDLRQCQLDFVVRKGHVAQ